MKIRRRLTEKTRGDHRPLLLFPESATVIQGELVTFMSRNAPIYRK